MARPTETERVYLDVINSQTATTGEKLQASIALDAHRKQKVVRERFSKSRKLLGLKVKDPKSKAISELPAYWQGTEFSRNTWAKWTAEKRREWLEINRLEN